MKEYWRLNPRTGGANIARPRKGRDVLVQAAKAIASVKTAVELRAAQAVMLSLQFGLSVARTAEATGEILLAGLQR
jgi:hypothetical protein